MTNTILPSTRHPATFPLPPSPPSHPLLGLMREFRQDRIGLYRRMARDYGDVLRMRFLWVNTYTISHPDYVRHVLVENNHNYVRNPFVNDVFKLFLGDGLFTMDGESWLSRRRLMQPAFHRQRLAGLGTLMTDAVEAMLADWAQWQEGQEIAVDEEMMKVTLRVAGQALFSVDLLGAARTLGDAFTGVSEFVNYRMNTPFPPPLWLPTRRNRQFKAALATLDHTVYRIIEERKGTGAHLLSPSSRRPFEDEQMHIDKEEKGDLLDMLMAARDADTGAGMTDEELRNEVALLIFAGHETTATTLTWAFYLLSQHPEAEAKLHAELATVLGGRTPTLADLPNLPYNRMVIEETMRLYPAAWGVSRKSVTADEVGGYQLPANASLTLPIATLHYDPRWWEQPERFDPERFTPERSANRHKFAYLPFGAGPRQCIGNNFALMEAQLVLATVAQRYQLRLRPGHPVQPDPVFVLRTSHGLPMTVVRRG